MTPKNLLFFPLCLLWVTQTHAVKVIIAGLNGTVVKDALRLPLQTHHLHLDSNQIKKIENGAICTTTTLRTVQIDFKSNNNSPVLTPDMFENCGNVTELIISGHKRQPRQFAPEILKQFPNLIHLNLRYFNISNLSSHFFDGVSSLNKLFLIDCAIKEVQPGVFDHVEDLEEIRLGYNEITRLSKGLFKNLSRLKHLGLSHNKIGTLEWDEFDGLTSLKSLDLGFNQISSFDADKVVKYLPKLDSIVIKHNEVDCYAKERFAEKLKGKYRHRVSVTYYDFVYFDYTTCDDEETHRLYLLKNEKIQ